MTGRTSIDTSQTIGFDVLDDAECLRLLAAEAVGRLAFTSAALPVVVPLNFTLCGRTVVFATEPGLELHAAGTGAVACLEIDGFDHWTHSGWSVLATGRLAEVTDAHRLATAEQLPLSPWA